MKPPECTEVEYGGGQDPQRVVAPVRNRSTILQIVVEEIN
jgi:hypothetical protein